MIKKLIYHCFPHATFILDSRSGILSCQIFQWSQLENSMRPLSIHDLGAYNDNLNKLPNIPNPSLPLFAFAGDFSDLFEKIRASSYEPG